MLKTSFQDKMEIDIYVAEQKIRMEKGFLTRSERETLKQIIINPKIYIHPENKKTKKGLTIITDISLLKQSCVQVLPGENIQSIVQQLKDTLEGTKGVGLSANQIGINKRVSYIRIPKPNKKPTEYVLVNPQIIEYNSRIVVPESCLSIPGLTVMVDRWSYITVVNHKLNGEPETIILQDLESIIFQHEIAHLNGRTILDDKHKAK